jgi:engulfment/cell motility protein 1
MQGAWFVNGVPAGSVAARESYAAPIRPQRPWRFMRLVHAFCLNLTSFIHSLLKHVFFQDKTMRFLYYVDSAMKIPMRSGIEDLPERSA